MAWSDQELLNIAKGLNIYYSMFLIIFGSICNVLAIIVLSRKAYTGTTFSIYFRYLAVIDLFTLYSGLSRHFIYAAFNYKTRDVHQLYCKLHQLTTATSPDISAWILVAVTAERVLSILKPFEVHTLFKKRNVAILLFFITGVLVLLNLPMLVNYGDKTVTTGNITVVLKCVINRPEMEYFMNIIWYWIDLIKFVLLPSFILSIFNTIIIVSVSKNREEVKKFCQSFSRNSTKLTSQVNFVPPKNVSMTVTLLAVNVVFIVLNSPISIYLIGRDYWFPPGFQATEKLTYTCSIMAMYTNNACNFLLYCATGSKFRGELKLLFGGLCRKVDRHKSYSTTATTTSRNRSITISAHVAF